MAWNKFRAVKTEVDGIVFDSKREAARYRELKLLEKAGEVYDIRVHERFPLMVNGVKIAAYEADFVYFQKTKTGLSEIVEDTKGVKTRAYIMKRKLMLALYGITILES